MVVPSVLVWWYCSAICMFMCASNNLGFVVNLQEMNLYQLLSLDLVTFLLNMLHFASAHGSLPTLHRAVY